MEAAETQSIGGSPLVLRSPSLVLRVWPSEGRYEIEDGLGGVVWRSNPHRHRLGAVTLAGDPPRTVELAAGEGRLEGDGLVVEFQPEPSKPQAVLRLLFSLAEDGRALEVAYECRGVEVESIRLLDDALWITDADAGYVVVPVREGLLVPSDSGVEFDHSFDTYAYEGCHLRMLGLVKAGAAALVTWSDPYVKAELRSALGAAGARQALSTSLELRRSARSFRLRFLGRGDLVDLGRAYRAEARQQGWLVTWEEKLKAHPERAKLLGAVNFKLWQTLDRRMNEESTQEERVRVNWTFDEAARIAEHLKRDLELDRVLFMIGGWIRRGYDNQHPDILPAAPECGGNEGLADCSRRVRDLGYLFCLHDNYQDMYRDSPSWDESYLMKTEDGRPALGGRWAGGRAYLTCSRRAVDLAKRPQNLPAVRDLTQANSYFIDTTYAAGLLECHDPEHPLTRADDMRWKQEISVYARELFGVFGSECGREWAIPHADFFEGLTGVSGTYYHDKGLVGRVGGTVVPLWEAVYRDTLALFGKYGYDFSQAAEYVLHHISIGRPLNYHSIPPHLYWQQPFEEEPPRADTSGDSGLFTRAHGGWAEALHPVDRFVKNTYEVLSPLHELTAMTTLTECRLLTPDRRVRLTAFGEGEERLEAVVNAGDQAYRHRLRSGEEVEIPSYGFAVDSPAFAAFHALSWRGLRYESPALFTLRSLDGKRLEESGRVRVFHGFGDARVRVGATEHRVPRESVVAAAPR